MRVSNGASSAETQRLSMMRATWSMATAAMSTRRRRARTSPTSTHTPQSTLSVRHGPSDLSLTTSSPPCSTTDSLPRNLGSSHLRHRSSRPPNALDPLQIPNHHRVVSTGQRADAPRTRVALEDQEAHDGLLRRLHVATLRCSRWTERHRSLRR